MRNLAVFFLAVFLFACNDKPDTNYTEVTFKGNLSFETGSLKSFNPKSWIHYHNPAKVTVTLTNDLTDNIVMTANSSKVFFEKGCDPFFVPHGTYKAHIEGGGWCDRLVSHGYFIWSIKDTVIKIDETTNIITFNLSEMPALAVRDQENGVDIYYQSKKMDWFSRYTEENVCDFMYLIPENYIIKYGTTKQDIKLKANEYVYCKVGKQTATVTLPIMEGDTISF